MAFAVLRSRLLLLRSPSPLHPFRPSPRRPVNPRRPPAPRFRPHARMAPPTAPLDKSRFRETWTLFALRVPSKLCNGARKALKQHVLLMPRVRSVLPTTAAERDPAEQPAMIVLLRYLAEARVSTFATPPGGNMMDELVGAEMDAVAEKVRGSRGAGGEARKFVEGVGGGDLVRREVEVGYEHWGIEDVLRNLMPAEVTVPSSYEGVGHIAHLNLRAEHADWKWLIGEVMLDKLGPRIRTVVNKLESTGGPYRTFAMEVLAGENNLVTSVRENGCVFRLDFAKVYWNSRLETEHRRIIQSLGEDDVLADAFCGVGPFAVPAAKEKRCRIVYANDLNPDSIKYLKENARANRVDEANFHPSCGCAKSFLQRIVRAEKVPITQVLMNYPSGAPEFLDVFNGLYKDLARDMPMPRVHCYCFIKGSHDMESARERVRIALLGEKLSRDKRLELLPNENLDVRSIRDVAPKKQQICITFQIPREVALGVQEAETVSTSPPAKKARITV